MNEIELHFLISFRVVQGSEEGEKNVGKVVVVIRII